MCECECWTLYKTATNVKLYVRENFVQRRSLTIYQLIGEIKNGRLFGYVQSDIDVPEI